MKGRNGRRLKPSRHRVRSEKRRDESADGRARVLIEQVEQFSSPRWGTGTNTHRAAVASEHSLPETRNNIQRHRAIEPIYKR